MDQLAESDKKEERLREEKELQFLRKHVQEREARIRDLEKDISQTVTGTNFANQSVVHKMKSRLAANLTGSVIPSSPGARQGKTTVSAPAWETGMPLLDINSLRQMAGLRKKAKKELSKIGLVLTDSSHTDSSSDSDSASEKRRDTDSESVGSSLHDRVKMAKTNKKHKTKSGITSKSSDSVRNKQRYPHAHLRFDFVSKNISFDKIEFNLFIAGE
ncbi:hypothetical protein DPMN_094098 [Dreissena polymorpha]|uniref:Uncharacterized protein n=1 Tax=Dreissena polymorpha TaxID=45954 RepID=A0A9D4L4U9_DREPO|nr:hypothetical protein DPMN_094098 [Dreissena polymorpha]